MKKVPCREDPFCFGGHTPLVAAWQVKGSCVKAVIGPRALQTNAQPGCPSSFNQAHIVALTQPYKPKNITKASI
jgi:hypothetical protein